jgi:enoyl-CoA hydratase
LSSLLRFVIFPRFVILSEAKDLLFLRAETKPAPFTVSIVHHVPVSSLFFQIESDGPARILRLTSSDGTNRLTRDCALALTVALARLKAELNNPLNKQPCPLIIAGNGQFFSVGADLNEIATLTGPEAYEFSAMGQALMNAIASYPAPVIAAIEGHCMGGGLDLALACHRRIAAPHAIFGHRGAALGLITGWGGTQRLPRLVGKGRALELFIAAEKISAARAFEIGLIDAIADDPVAEALRQLQPDFATKPATSSEKPTSTSGSANRAP